MSNMLSKILRCRDASAPVAITVLVAVACAFGVDDRASNDTNGVIEAVREQKLLECLIDQQPLEEIGWAYNLRTNLFVVSILNWGDGIITCLERLSLTADPVCRLKIARVLNMLPDVRSTGVLCKMLLRETVAVNKDEISCSLHARLIRSHGFSLSNDQRDLLGVFLANEMKECNDFGYFGRVSDLLCLLRYNQAIPILLDLIKDPALKRLHRLNVYGTLAGLQSSEFLDIILKNDGKSLDDIARSKYQLLALYENGEAARSLFNGLSAKDVEERRLAARAICDARETVLRVNIGRVLPSILDPDFRVRSSSYHCLVKYVKEHEDRELEKEFFMFVEKAKAQGLSLPAGGSSGSSIKE